MLKHTSSSLSWQYRFGSAVSIVRLEDDELFLPLRVEPISKARHSLPPGDVARYYTILFI